VPGRTSLPHSSASTAEGGEGADRLPAAEIAFLAVPDPAVSVVAEAIGTRLPAGSAIVHVSGALGLAALDGAGAGRPIGSFHPFQSFPAVRPPSAFEGSLIAVDANGDELAARLFQLARDIGGKPRRVTDRERALYHAAAVLGANLLVGLAATASRVLESLGWTEEDALAALVPLMSGVTENLATEGLAGALIGPIRRGDAATVRRHLEELDRNGLEEAGRVYRILGTATLELALATGLDPASGEQIREALTG
jgi:predicted short-subunit dehydrogenase-like oxidoreductase (DUF2520 family)